jgi:hypothetical protein
MYIYMIIYQYHTFNIYIYSNLLAVRIIQNDTQLDLEDSENIRS